MPVATAATIRTQILAGTFPDNTIEDANTFDYEQYERRRRYPSCEVIVTSPEGTEETKQGTISTFGFEIRYYIRNLGVRTDEVSTQKSVEDVIISQIESFIIQDHKIILESKRWDRKQFQRDKNHPAYTVSTLSITIRQITTTTAVVDGVLKFSLSGSSTDSPPGADYTYTNVYDVDISEGYRSIAEQANNNTAGTHVPHRYAGEFSGRFIGNIPVKVSDLGTTGDKLNKLMTVRSTGEKPIVEFIYTNKTDEVPPSTITETIQLDVDSITRLYIFNNNVVYRIIATISAPSTIVTS